MAASPDPPSPPSASPDAPRARRPRWIGAHELADFTYCAKSWGYRQRYGDPDDPATLARLRAGQAAHAEEGTARLHAERAIRRGRWWWVWLGLALLLLWWITRGR
jgi:hypothetical protein